MWGRLQYLGLPQAGRGGLRHQGNVRYGKGSGEVGPLLLPSQSATFWLAMEMIILLTRSLLLLAFAVHLAERFLQGL